MSTATDRTMIADLGIAVSAVIVAVGYILSIASKGQIVRKRLEIMYDEQKK